MERMEAREAPPLRAEACDEQPPPRRAVDYLLAGTSVTTNRHLARFAAAPYLKRLLENDAFRPMMNRSSKQLRKEISEAFAVVEALESALGGVAPTRIVDLCSGKGFLATVLALEYPGARVLQVDNNPRIKTEHVRAVANLTFLVADVMHAGFEAQLAGALAGASEAGAGEGRCVVVGVHLCGPLSPRAIDLFEAFPAVEALLLVPCCLDRRTDGLLKARAKQLGIEPYEAKVQELAARLREVGGMSEVRTLRDDAMLTGGGGAPDGRAKNAILIGRRRAEPPPMPAPVSEPVAALVEQRGHGGGERVFGAAAAAAAAAALTIVIGRVYLNGKLGWSCMVRTHAPRCLSGHVSALSPVW